MIDGMTVEEYNARERRRGSIVAKLHGYTPLEESDTEEALAAEYLVITGDAYRSQEEEQADNLQAAKERRQQRIEAQLDGDHAIIAEAKANGFLDCRAVRDALGYDKPKPNGAYYSSMQVAFHWIEEADEEVVYLMPDGITNVTTSERTGCYPDAFARVLAAKEEWDADRAAREQKSWDDAQAAKDAFDKQKADELAEIYDKQNADRKQRASERAERHAQLDAKREAEIQLLIAEAEAEDEPRTIPADRRAAIIADLRTYSGPLSKNNLPTRKGLNDHSELKIKGWEKRECWQESAGRMMHEGHGHSLEQRIERHLEDSQDVVMRITRLEERLEAVRSILKWVAGIIGGVGIALIGSIIFAALQISQ